MRKQMTAGVLMLALTAMVQAQDFGDTPYVQTPQNVVDAMLKTAKVSKSDYVIDLGSGDGRMVITAAKQYGARGFGVDLDKHLVNLANNNAKKAGVADRAKRQQVAWVARLIQRGELKRAVDELPEEK